MRAPRVARARPTAAALATALATALAVTGVALLVDGAAGGSPPPSPAAAVASGSPSPDAPPPATPSPAQVHEQVHEQAPVDLLPASPPTRLSVPDLGVDAALVRLGLQDDGTLQVPADGASVGWYTGSPTPGQVGPTVLAGHVSWERRPAVFFDLGAVRPGERVSVSREDGARVTYRVTAVEQYPKDRFPTLQVYGNTAAPELRLITCGGEFDEASGHHRDDVVVYAVLDSVTRAWEPSPGTTPGSRTSRFQLP